MEALRTCAKAARGPHLAIFDGAYAVRSVVQPLMNRPDGQPRIDWLTRLRYDARLYQPPPPRQPGQMGRPRKWGSRLPAPKDADSWPWPWRESQALVYGKMRRIRYKKLHCQWHPAGADARVHVFAFQVEGYKKRGSVRDIKRLLVEAEEEFSQLHWQRPTFEKPACLRAGGRVALRDAA